MGWEKSHPIFYFKFKLMTKQDIKEELLSIIDQQKAYINHNNNAAQKLVGRMDSVNMRVLYASANDMLSNLNKRLEDVIKQIDNDEIEINQYR